MRPDRRTSPRAKGEVCGGFSLHPGALNPDGGMKKSDDGRRSGGWAWKGPKAKNRKRRDPGGLDGVQVREDRRAAAGESEPP